MTSEIEMSNQARQATAGQAEPDAASETTWLKSGAETNGQTWTGTITRGQKVGELVEVQLTSKELDAMQKSYTEEQEVLEHRCECSARSGPHVCALGVVAMPIALLFSAAVTFYQGTITWYNMVLYFSDERTFWHRLFVAPLLVLFYPALILVVVVAVSLYAAVVQVSWHLSKWWAEIRDFEKGVCGLVCMTLRLESCSPYDVVLLEKTLELPQQAPPHGDVGQSNL
ncbi:PREDICTED: transmembrane protein 169-like [Priapulus caudatus]|uniref:Transmembrane protein 169-like n=1 Tax=Priapulus caudatus TaxID=37621 RepID=A0ABM1DR85_PRICU|nr:PREDICTED: transmembrane protein 169-like [Priapulus caudatus]